MKNLILGKSRKSVVIEARINFTIRVLGFQTITNVVQVFHWSVCTLFAFSILPFYPPPQSYQHVFHYDHYWYCCSLVKRPQSFHVNRKTRRQPYQKPNLFISCTFQLLLIYFHEFLNEFCSSLCCFVTTRGRVQISCCLAQSPIRQRLPTYVKAEANQQRTWSLSWIMLLKQGQGYWVSLRVQFFAFATISSIVSSSASERRKRFFQSTYRHIQIVENTISVSYRWNDHISCFGLEQRF